MVLAVDWHILIPLVRRIPWWMLLASFVVFSLSQLVIAIRWYYLLHFIDSPSPFFRLLDLVFIGAFASNFLPTTIGGDAVKIVGICRRHPQRSVATASVIADRLFNLAGMILLFPLVFALPSIRIPFALENHQLTGVGFIGLDLWEKNKERVRQTWIQVRRWFTSFQCVFTSLTLSWLSILLAFASFWIVTSAVGIRISFWQASAIGQLSYFVALFPLSINGLGILESSETYFLTLQGATLEQAVAAAFLIRLVTMFVSLFGGVRLMSRRQEILLQTEQKGENKV
jgi:uncharacterized membrane protein YbhN (UPF0104 family)